LTLQWILALAAALVALVALARARRSAKRLERLSESYWELRYECGQLSARLDQLEGSTPKRPAPGQSPAIEPNAFVPLSSLKK
jgi:hypothetical protein